MIHGHLTSGWPRRSLLLVLLLVAAGLLGLAAAPPASATGSVTVSDDHPTPGQVVTVRGSGLGAGKPATIEFQPGAVRLANLATNAQGGFSQDVQIPSGTTDGTKLIVVKSVGTDGRFTRLPIGIEVKGAPASAALSDDTLVPEQAFRVQGDRFAASGPVAIVLYPEGVDMGLAYAGSDGRLDASVRMPKLLLNGRHGFLVAGLAAGGRFAVLKLYATVTGGVGGVPAGDPLEGVDIPLLPPTTTPTTAKPSTTSTKPPIYGENPDRGISGVAVAIIVILALLLIVVTGTWLASSQGRTWRRERVARRERKREMAAHLR